MEAWVHPDRRTYGTAQFNGAAQAYGGSCISGYSGVGQVVGKHQSGEALQRALGGVGWSLVGRTSGSIPVDVPPSCSVDL